VWNTYGKSDIETLETVEKRATKILQKLRHLKYSDLLKKMQATYTTLSSDERRYD